VDDGFRPELSEHPLRDRPVTQVAFRVPDDEEQLAWRKKLLDLGYTVSPVMDRQYFHSIYYREPGGVLFELATDPPGFTADESPEALGTGLKLPPQYEQQGHSHAAEPVRNTRPAIGQDAGSQLGTVCTAVNHPTTPTELFRPFHTGPSRLR